MPSLNESRKKVETTIPSVPGSKVVLWDDLTAGDFEKIHESTGTNIGKMVQVLALALCEWNLEEEPTIDNLWKLPFSDLEHILSATTFYLNAKKKAEDIEEELQQKKTNS